MLWVTYGTMTLLLIIGMLLIFVVLLQRGRGGGLAGALGGMGGQSAFGTKAGDLFTRITVVLAIVWIVLCAGQIPLLRAVSTKFKPGESADTIIQKAPGDNKRDLNIPLGAGSDKAADDADAKTDGEEKRAAKNAEDDTEKKTDAKSETKSDDEPKAEEKSEPKSEEKSETKSEAKPDEKTESEPKSDEKPQE